MVPPGFPVAPTGLTEEEDEEDEEEGYVSIQWTLSLRSFRLIVLLFLSHLMTSSFYTCTHSLYHSTRLIRDNFHALATRIQNWTASDAARFLRVATQRRRRRPRSRPELMTAVMDLPPAFLYRTISFREPTNSYEVCVCCSVCTCIQNICCSFRIYPTLCIYRHGRKSLIWTFLIETKQSSHQTPFRPRWVTLLYLYVKELYWSYCAAAKVQFSLFLLLTVWLRKSSLCSLSTQDLLELAERLGPARCQGLSKQGKNQTTIFCLRGWP